MAHTVSHSRLARAIEAKGGLLCAGTTVQTVEERGGEVVEEPIAAVSPARLR
jgi:hypothetical protein